MARLDPAIRRAELSVQSLFGLLGGTSVERQRFWEIVRGITTPAEYRLANGAIRSIASQLDAVSANLKEIEKAARQVNR